MEKGKFSLFIRLQRNQKSTALPNEWKCPGFHSTALLVGVRRSLPHSHTRKLWDSDWKSSRGRMWTLLKIKLIRQQLNRENVIWFNRSMKTNRHFKKRVTNKVNNFKIGGSDQGNVPSRGQQIKVSPTAEESRGYSFQCHPTCTAPTPCTPGHSKTQDWRDLHRTVCNMTQCLLTPTTSFFL